MSNNPEIGKYQFEICSYHTDLKGNLFIHHLFNFLQDVAHRHANGLGFGMPQLQKSNLFWVLSRLSIEIDKLPCHEDMIEVSTWVKSINSARSEREFSISLNEEVIIRASSMWFCLSAKDHRPVSVPTIFQEKMTPYDVYASSGAAKKVELVNEAENVMKGVLLKTRHSDIDMVNHVNNAAYVRWVIDEFRSAKPYQEIREFNINYLSETFLGDEVRIYVSTLGGTALCLIERTSDKVPICKASIR